MDPDEKELERFLLGMAQMSDIPLSDEMQSIAKELQTPTFATDVDTTMEATPAPPPPPIVPAQPMLNGCPQTVENLNAVNAVYMEAAPAPPPQLMAAPAVYNQGGPAFYSQVAPAVYGQADPAFYGQGAPAVYSQCVPAVYGQADPAVYGQADPAFYGQGPPAFQPLYGQNTMQTSGYLYNQSFAQSQVQYLPSQQPVYFTGAPVACAPQQQFMQMSMANQDFTLPVVGVLNGEVVYGMPTGPHAAAPANNTTAKQKQPKAKEPYIKKPPNAFMLFLKDQRPSVMAEVKLLTNDTINSATVNSILGQRWKTMTREQKRRYIQEAEREKQIHNMQNPGWSPSQNYGKNKRVRQKASENIEESTLAATDFTGLVKDTVLMGPPISKVPQVTIPDFFSLHPQPSNSASNNPESPMQQ